MEIRKSSILNIPYNIIYLPFLLFIILTFLYNVVALAKDIKQIIRSLKGKSEL